jgi:hypothetical protein
MLAAPPMVARLTRLLAAAVKPLSGPGGADAGAAAASAAQYQDALVRLLAGAVSAPTVPPFLAAGGLPALIAVMRAALPSLAPAGRAGGGAEVRPRGVALGNACKLLISLTAAPPEVCPPGQLVAAGACDVLVDCVKAAGSSAAGDAVAGTLRKNGAVALARLSRDAAALGRIRELRGVEILMQLRSELML